MYPECVEMVSKCPLGLNRPQTNLEHAYNEFLKNFEIRIFDLGSHFFKAQAATARLTTEK